MWTGVSRYPDEDREERACIGGQADVGVQEVLVEEGVGEHAQPGQHRRHLQVQLIRLEGGGGERKEMDRAREGWWGKRGHRSNHTDRLECVEVMRPR